ncbi:hypothetical protein XENORESO_016839, partial [Xenotaenia resolanae]
ALSISDHYPVEVELKIVQTALRQRNNAASHARNTSSKGSLYFNDHIDVCEVQLIDQMALSKVFVCMSHGVE